MKIPKLNWAFLVAIVSALAGVAGAIGEVVGTFSSLVGEVQAVLIAISGVLVIIPAGHASSVVAAKAKLKLSVLHGSGSLDVSVGSVLLDRTWVSRVAGRRGAIISGALPRVMLADFLTSALAKATAAFDYAKQVVGGFPMALNDELGDCTIAGFWHLVQLAYAVVGQTIVYPGDEAVRAAYLKLTGGQDTGLELETVLTAASSPEGLLGVRLIGWGAIDTNDIEAMITAAFNFGGIYLAGNIPASAETDFEDNDGEWVVHKGHNPGIGGHCFVASGSDLLTLFKNETWGAENEFSFGFWRKYGLQAYAVIPEVFETAGHGALANVNVTALQAAIGAKESQAA